VPSYSLEIEAISFYNSYTPSLEIWADGMLETSTTISSMGSMINLTINYAGALPSSLEFIFDDASSEVGRTIEVRSVKINNNYVNIGNYLSDNSLLKNDTAVVDVASADYIFNPSEPDTSTFACNALSLTNNNDRYRNYSGDDLVIDALDGRDFILLGNGADNVHGGNGNDIIRTGSNDDFLYGQQGNDRLYGEEGNDLIYGGLGDDQLYGGFGDDEIHGNDGHDKIIGGAGHDVLTGGLGNDRIFGRADNDVIYGGDGDDVILSGTGNDTIDGGSGHDLLRGGIGDDIIDGGDGDDKIDGGANNDILAGHLGNNIIYGRDGDDTIYGGSDQNIIYGGSGVDTIYSGSADNLDSTISAILANNAGVVYSAQTNSFYQYISTDVTWTTAMSSSALGSLTGLAGVNGHLLTITSSVENDYISNYLGVEDSWLAATDATTEGEWFWVAGPENGSQFWTGGSAGSAVNGFYSQWIPGDPSNASSSWDYGVILGSGGWLSDRNSAPGGYVIEWEAAGLITTVDRTFIDSGAGADVIYASDGLDVISFSDVNGVDTIYSFDITQRDALDIDDIISYDSVSDDLSGFIQLSEASGDTILAIDQDGPAGGSSFTNIVVLDSVTGLDLDAMISSANLIVS